ncbi:glycoside hydrolase family 3 protein [Peniophora sp. CONT]|nr:glycoside hydrolase family 3 protein [Peniophora sp. CONT]
MRRPNIPSLAFVFFGSAAAQNATTASSLLSSASSTSPLPVSTVLTPSTTPSLSAIPSFTDAPSAISVITFSTLSPSGIVTDTSAAATGIPSTSAATFATFSAVPSPSTGPSVPGVFPATSPDSPPPVESPGLVPDFSAAWAAAWSKAQDKVATLDNKQKTNLTSGQVGVTGRCVGQTGSIPGLPDTGLCLQDAPIGVRNTDFVTAFPSGFSTAATWRRDLMRARGLGIGEEHRNKGVNIALGPMMNLLRAPLAGRNWEGFGADPYLTGEAAYETILGMQAAGVQACAKHLLLNEQETFRMIISSNADDRTTHELYLIPFIRSVMAGVSSVMCSYNQLNGTYACENDRLLNGLLKNELGFQGMVMSDWLATHSTIQAVNSGLDMEMPFNIFLDGLLQIAIDLGFVAQARLDDMVTRILAGFYLLGQDDPSYPTLNFNQNDVTDDATNEHVDVQGIHDVIVREIATTSIVMLKNNGILPLQAPRSMAVIGSDAGPARNKGPNEFTSRMGEDGILVEGYGSGTVSMTYLISPYEALQSRARLNRTTFEWMWDDSDTGAAASYAKQKDVALVFIQADAGEGFDRLDMNPDNNGNALVEAVAAVNKNTVVVINSADPLILDSWIENINVSAVLWAGVSGPEAGNAITDVLYGVANPSGKLPFTIAKSQSDYNAGIELITVDYKEELNIDYRHFDSAGIEPRFEFGFGLSYTTFSYSDLSISAINGGSDNDTELEANWANGLPSPNGVGSSTALWLHRPAYQVSFTITNTGNVPGTEIAQLYLNHPSSAGEPPSILKGFTDVSVVPGASETVTLLLSRFDLSIWDVVSQSWVKPSGSYGITIGASSRDARLNGTLTV